MMFSDLFHKPAHFTPPHPRAVANLTWAIPIHLPAIREINASIKDPWPRDELAELVHDDHTSAMVAERSGRIVGFMGYKLHDLALELVYFAVHPECRNIGVGLQLFDTLDRKLAIHSTPRLTAAISELDPQTWAWFLNRGMRGCGLRRDGIRPGVDAYVFEFWAPDPMAVGVGNCPSNPNDIP